MKDLTNKKKLDYILKMSKKLGITSYDFGQNTPISDLGARNILNGNSQNPRTKNINIMYDYIKSIEENTTGFISEPPTLYTTKNKTQLLRIAIEFVENYESIKDFPIVKNVIEIEVLQRLLANQD